MCPSDDVKFKATIQLPPADTKDDPEDLNHNAQSIQIRIRMTNSTSGLPIGEDNSVHLIQVLDAGLILQAPSRSCAVGHKLLLDISARSQLNDPIVIEGTAQITEVLSVSKNIDELTVKLIQYNEARFKALLELLSQRQQEISEFVVLSQE